MQPVFAGGNSTVAVGTTTSVVDSVESGAATVSKVSVPLLTHVAHWTPPLAAGALALISQWNHHIEKNRITHEYDAEIASRLGKPISEVKMSDMEKVAKENPVIAEALNRSKKRRNLSIVVTALGVAAAVGIASVLVTAFATPLAGTALVAGASSAIGGALSASTIAHLALGGVAGGLSFLGIENQLEKFGEKKLHLKEPSMDEVKRKPALQAQLSVPSQITYLEKLQAKKQVITQEQVMTAFAAANPELGRQVEVRYGATFDKLSEKDKSEATRTLGGQYAIPELTDDINNRHMRVQEIAFAASGQSSGVQSVGDIQRANVRMQQRIKALNAQLNDLYAQPQNARSAPVADEPEQTAWRDRVLAQRQAKASAMGA
jgi:hypothetical protein